MREEDAIDSFASMFQAGFAAELERIEKRQRAERRSSLTTKQRKRGATRTAQIKMPVRACRMCLARQSPRWSVEPPG